MSRLQLSSLSNRLVAATSSIALAACAALATPALAQGPRIVGITATTPLVVSQDIGTCALAQCIPIGMPAPAPGLGFVGGTAYDNRTRGVWVSDGLMIGKYDVRNACAVQCPAVPMPNTSPNNPVTGLAYYAPTSTLYVTDRSNVVRWYSVTGGCTLTLVSRCILPIPAGDVITGCATDDWTGQIFYTVITPTALGGRVVVAQIGAPCLPFCQFPVTTCGGNPMAQLMGIGYDSCAEVLWITDGRRTKGLRFDPINCLPLTEVQCCLNTLDPYIGLDLMPSTEISSGPNCTTPTCPPCPSMQHRLGSDPFVGNTAFTLDLVAAPGGSTAVLVLNIGPCGPPVPIPPFCAGIRVGLAPPPLTAFSPTGGGIGLCNGMAAINIPIPANQALCGLPLCSQYIGICPGGGTFASNALQWSIVGA